MKVKWVENETILIGETPKFKQKDKSAGFDLDATIIKYNKFAYSDKSKKEFCELQYDNIAEKLAEISEEYSIIIITNQSEIKRMKNVDKFKMKVDIIYKLLNVEFKIYVATGRDIYRKPCTGLVSYGLNLNFYCGDFAGRIYSSKKKDHGDTDIKFAYNLGITFVTPEEYFLKKKHTTNINYIDFTKLKNDMITNIKKPYYLIPDLSKKEMIINIGVQGSGKTFFTNKYFIPFGYVHISNDIQKGKAYSTGVKMINKGHSVVIDNTNPSKKSRQKYIALAKKNNMNIVAIHFATDIQLAKHNNCYRSFYKNEKYVPDIAYNIYKKHFEKPRIDEGFTKIIKIDFTLDTNNINEKDYLNNEDYFQYLC